MTNREQQEAEDEKKFESISSENNEDITSEFKSHLQRQGQADLIQKQPFSLLDTTPKPFFNRSGFDTSENN